MNRVLRFLGRGLVVGSMGVVVGVGCGGGGVDPEKEQQREQLDACGYPEPCDEARLTYSLEPLGARTCILKALAAGGPAHLRVNIVADGGGDCKAEVEYYLPGDGSVYEWSRFDHDCSTDPAAVDYSYELELCTLKSKAFFEACLAANPEAGGECDGAWATDCAAAEPDCP